MRPAWTRGWVGLAAVGATVGVALVTAVLVLGSSEGSGPTPVTVSGNSLALIDPDDNRVVEALALGGKPTRLAYGDGAFWAAVPEAGSVVRVDEETRAVKRFRVGKMPYDVAVGGGAIWVPDHDLRRLLRLDGETGSVRRSEDFGAPAVSVGYGFEAVWIVVVPGVLMRLDPHTLKVTRTTPNVGETTESAEPKLVFADDALWISSPASGALTRIDPTGTKSTRNEFGITSVAAANATIWTTNESGYVSELRNGETKRIRVGEIPLDVTATKDAVWVAAYEDRAVNRVDRQERRVVASIRLGHHPIAVAAGASLVAVAVEESPF